MSGPKGWGWLTDKRTKYDLVAYAHLHTGGSQGEGEEKVSDFDWCDSEAVDQMQAYIRDEKGKMTAPKGTHDDCLMARMITAYVSHMVKPTAELYIEDTPSISYAAYTPAKDRLKWMMTRDEEDYEELDGHEE